MMLFCPLLIELNDACLGYPAPKVPLLQLLLMGHCRPNSSLCVVAMGHDPLGKVLSFQSCIPPFWRSTLAKVPEPPPVDRFDQVFAVKCDGSRIIRSCELEALPPEGEELPQSLPSYFEIIDRCDLKPSVEVSSPQNVSASNRSTFLFLGSTLRPVRKRLCQ